MSNKDIVSNFLSTIKNGYLAKKYKIIQPNFKKIRNILNLLISEGFIRGYKLEKYNYINSLVIFLKYDNNIPPLPVLKDIKRISKPGKRVYIKNKNIYKTNDYLILSTSKGILTKLQAKKFNIGGEVICKIL